MTAHYPCLKRSKPLIPTDPIATDYVLNTVLFKELYRLDLLDTTFYAHDGFLTGKHAPAHVDPAVAERVNSLTQQAVSLAEERLKADPKDVDALFARGLGPKLECRLLRSRQSQLRFRPASCLGGAPRRRTGACTQSRLC